jgi:hypothetical protein
MPGLLRGVARTAVIAGTATHVSNNVSRRQANRWASKEQQQAPQQYEEAPQQYEAPPPAAAAPAPDMDAKLAQLKELGQLKEAGVLTDFEFETQKNRILNG